jgi:hypothetical protein
MEATAARGADGRTKGDFLNDQADARIWLAEVLELAGRSSEAVDATRDTLDSVPPEGQRHPDGDGRSAVVRLDAAAD